MPAGRHDKRVTIQTKTVTTNAGGNQVPTWSEPTKRWAMLQEMGGKELLRAQKIDPEIDAVITLRDAYDNLTVEDRIIYGSRTFWIKAILGASDRAYQRGQIIHVKELV